MSVAISFPRLLRRTVQRMNRTVDEDFVVVKPFATMPAK
jgi:hypothetical protein